MTMKIAFLGPQGTYTEEAACELLKHLDDVELIPYPSIDDCLWSAHDEHVDACVVPIENSIEGSVSLTLDTLVHKVDIPIQAEIVVPIAHTLYAKKNMQLNQITKLSSHPHALAQCRQFIKEYLPQAELIEMKSTASACQAVYESEDETVAAIGTPLAETIYELVSLQSEIQDYDNNFTRFILCGQQIKMPHSTEHKTSLQIILPHDFQGALYQVLAAFAWRKINLSRIESRPTKKQLGNYFFFIDLEQGMDDILLPGAIAEIEALGCKVRHLGSYPSFTKERTVLQASPTVKSDSS